MTDEEVKLKHRDEIRAKKEALKGFTTKRRKLIQAIGPVYAEGKPMKEAALRAGYSQQYADGKFYNELKNPRLQEAIRLYYGLGEDKLLGDLGCGTVVEVLSNKKLDANAKAPYTKLALQVAGKLKNINYNANINVSASKEDILSLLNDSNT